jgi:signal transduction histidine kinase
MAGLLQNYRRDPTLVPPFDARLAGHVSEAGQARITLPPSAMTLPPGIHELIIGGREVHVAVASLDDARIYRVYDFSAYEQHFRDMSNVLVVGAGGFALLTIWLAYSLSGLLIRQVTRFVHQVKALRQEPAAEIIPGRHDETEVVELIAVFNEYHRRMARMIEREKEFTANLSHELRTPLTAIRTSCELLDQDGAISDKSRARLRQVDHAAQRMSELVNTLLLLAREESATKMRPVPLAEIIEDTLGPFSDVLGAKEVRVLVDVDHGLQVNVNRAALMIVLSNLVDNAVRHTERGHLRFIHRNGRLRIEDSGSGISPEAVAHVFTRFYRAASNPAADPGFGIGLAIVKKICDRYRWGIELDSTPGRGTCVSLELPPAGGPEAAGALNT